MGGHYTGDCSDRPDGAEHLVRQGSADLLGAGGQWSGRWPAGLCRQPRVDAALPPRCEGRVMAVPVFDALIHAPGRLHICAILSAAEAEFAVVRDSIKV